MPLESSKDTSAKFGRQVLLNQLVKTIRSLGDGLNSEWDHHTDLRVLEQALHLKLVKLPMTPLHENMYESVCTEKSI